MPSADLKDSKPLHVISPPADLKGGENRRRDPKDFKDPNPPHVIPTPSGKPP